MLPQNDEERRRTNTDVWHKAGYTGKGIHIVMFDKKATPHKHMTYATSPFVDKPTISHGTNTTQVGHEFAPDAKVTMLYSGEKCRQWFKDHAHEIDIVNISMSSLKQTAEHSWGFLKDYPHITVFCSSGNDYDKDVDGVSYPAAFDWTIAVGAFEDSREALAHYSNGGEMLDLVGFTDIYIPNDEGKPFKYNGTSSSSPQVAFTIACYIQYLKENGIEYDRETIREFLHENAIDIEEEGFDYASGYGLMRMPETIPIIEKEPAVTPTPKPLPTPEPTPMPTQPEEDVFYRVVTGSFSSRENANQRMSAIKEKGISSFLLAETINGATMFRVITGSFSDRENAESRRLYLQSLGFTSFIAIYKK